MVIFKVASKLEQSWILQKSRYIPVKCEYKIDKSFDRKCPKQSSKFETKNKAVWQMSKLLNVVKE